MKMLTVRPEKYPREPAEAGQQPARRPYQEATGSSLFGCCHDKQARESESRLELRDELTLLVFHAGEVPLAVGGPERGIWIDADSDNGLRRRPDIERTRSIPSTPLGGVV